MTLPEDTAELRCQNPECRVSETGKCVEGLPFEQCPHLIRSSSDTEAAPSAAAELAAVAEKPGEGISLPSGDRLDVAQLTKVLRAGVSRVSAVIGPSDAGKTSLIASIYGLLQDGPVADSQFARSHTLVAFEQASHHARAASLRAVPHTERTLHGSGLGFYDLELLQTARNATIALVLADRPGEDYRTAADDPAVSSTFVEVHRADSIVLLVDGGRLRDLGQRHNVKNEIEMILQGLIDGDATCANQRIAVVLTKLDLVRASTAAEMNRTESYFETIVGSIRQIFGRHFAEVRSLKVAASPTSEALPRGFGVAELIDLWTAPVVTRQTVLSAQTTSGRAMAKLTVVN